MSTFIPKYIQIRKAIREQIRTGQLKPKDQISTEAELMSEYGVSRITVLNAIRDLVSEGLLVRERPLGTFVADQSSVITDESLVGVLTHAHGHIYKDFVQSVVRHLQNMGYYALVFDTCDTESDDMPKDILHKVAHIIDSRLCGLIVEGLSSFPFELLRQKKDKIGKLVFVYHYETPDRFLDADFVLSDYEYGGYIAINHLLELGHKRIALLSHKPQEQSYFFIHSLIKGCHRAFAEHGLNQADCFTLITDEGDHLLNVKKIKSILSDKDRPTAIFALGDYKTRSIFRAAREVNLNIPDDLALVGYYNTPWCEMLEVPLTSISTKETEIAQIACQLVTENNTVNKTVLVKPDLIIRGSSGGCRTGSNMQQLSVNDSVECIAVV